MPHCLVFPCFVTEPCEVDEKRPLQPNSASTQSKQDFENEHETVNKQESEISPVNNKTEDLITFNDNDTIETNNQSLPNEKVNAQVKETPLNETRNLSRRKQKTPAKLVSYASADDDDDITDDETQTYSLDDHNIKGNGTG